MPQETIDSLDDSLKQVIWETAPETPQEFVSVETETSEDCIPLYCHLFPSFGKLLGEHRGFSRGNL